MTKKHSKTLFQKAKGWFTILGPGIITGAADDDPSGIATYSQAGAQSGYGLLWSIVFSYPMMVAIQIVSAQIGRTTGKGLAANMKMHFPKWITISIVFLMLAANIINIGADISAMGEAVQLVIGDHSILYAIALAIIGILLQVFIPYDRYVSYLKWLCVVLFAYVAVVFSVHVPWAEALAGTIIPSITWNSTYITTIIAVLGTTISPYLFFWQASEEAEEEEDNPRQHPLNESPEQAPKQLSRIRRDTIIGMGFSNLIAFFIMLSTAVTLHSKGVTDINTAAQAAEALRPIAGEFTFLLFAIGIIGTGLLALPVLAGSAAYAVAEVFSLPMSLEKKPKDAKGFYGLIAGITIAGMLLIFIGVNPIKALYWSAVINGIVAVPIMIIMMVMAHNKSIMGKFTISRRLSIAGWISTAIMFAAGLGLLLTL
ncbi:MAG: Nramp family divalent metal transporter [Bacteroidota bacterium]|nr:Nramp family divalent metal transporter [Bacteroidota bacterium]MDP4229465.1 Nramp family divalent metal transporter [Bacteroidota bacterium]